MVNEPIKCNSVRTGVQGMLVLITCLGLLGCATGGQTGAVAGGGIGALAGQAIGGSTEATLIGAAVGTGVGYIIGNEVDKKKAREMSATTQSSGYAHTETGALAGTRWKVVSLAPRERVGDFSSIVVEFRGNARSITTRTNPDGTVVVHDESYRVVGDTLIVNRPGYIINARYAVSGNQLILNADEFRAVLERI